MFLKTFRKRFLQPNFLVVQYFFDEIFFRIEIGTNHSTGTEFPAHTTLARALLHGRM